MIRNKCLQRMNAYFIERNRKSSWLVGGVGNLGVMHKMLLYLWDQRNNFRAAK
jgi:hypothetical protein